MICNNKWYSAGNVTAINGSTTISGKNTTWLEADIKQGDIFVLSNHIYEISRVTSNTELILVKTFSGTSIESTNYAIIQRAPQVLATDIAYKLEKMIENWEAFVTDYNTKFIELKSIANIIKKAGFYIDEDGDLAQDETGQLAGQDLSNSTYQSISDNDVATNDDTNEMFDEVFNQFGI